MLHSVKQQETSNCSFQHLLHKSVLVTRYMRKYFTENFSMIMVADQGIIRNRKVLNNITKIVIGIRITTICEVTGDDAQFCI